jgi:uracil-DNA glycosylase family 4
MIIEKEKIKRLGLELPFDKCSTCSMCPKKEFEPKSKDVSWGEWKSQIDIIFISDKGTQYDNILGGKDGDALSEIIIKNNIQNYLVTAVTLCRPEEGQAPKPGDIAACYNNIETIITTVIKTNAILGAPAPTIVLLGKTVLQRFFDDPKFTAKKAKLGELRFDVYSSDKYPGCNIYITYHPAVVLNDDSYLPKIEQDIMKAYTKKDAIDEGNTYLRVDSFEEFEGVMEYLSDAEVLVYDIETTGNKYITMQDVIKKKRKRKGQVFEETIINWKKDVIIGISFAKERNNGVYIPLWVRGKHFPADRAKEIYPNEVLNPKQFYFWIGKEYEESVIASIKKLIEDPNIKKSNQNIKFDNQFLISQLDIHPANVWNDTMLASHALNENTPNSLEYNTDKRYVDMLGYKQKVYSKLTKEKTELEDYGDIDLDTLALYGAQDSDATWRLTFDLRKEMQIEQQEAKRINKKTTLDAEWMLDNFYMPLQEIYTRAELLGIQFDKDYAEKVAQLLQKDCDSFQADVDETFKELTEGNEKYPTGKLNLSSPQQMQWLLFVDLGWPILKVKEKGQEKIPANASTDKDHMKLLYTWFETQNQKHPGKYAGELEFLEGLLVYKNKKKFINTYLRGKKILSRLDTNGRVHTSFLIHGTVSGRLSSRPNVQNIPRDKRIRGIFTAAEGYDLFGCDLSQAELRIMAEYAQDHVMLDWINRNIDIHWEATKGVMYPNQPDLIYDPTNKEHKDHRKTMKSGNFGRLYGAATDKVMQTFNEKLERGEPKPSRELIEKHGQWFFSTFFGIADFLKEQEDFILTYGYVESLFGRRRRLPDAFSDNKFKRAEAVRQGINAQIQGTASDITQFGAIRIDKFLRENNYKSRFLFSVHDELIFELWKEESEELQKIIPVMMVEKVYPCDRFKVKLDSEGTLYNHHWGWGAKDTIESILLEKKK